MMKPGRFRLIVLVCALALVAVAAGCAYYNTLYNARQRFRDAELQQRDREGNITRTAEYMYDEVIAKSRKMIETWPDSRHVDDAYLLIARSYYGSERYQACVRVVDTLITQIPDTELLPQALSLKGSAYSQDGQHEEAVVVLEERLERFDPTPDNLYHLCTSLMSLERSDDAVHYLGILEDKFSGRSETFDARVTMAEILAEQEQYEQSRAVYERLTAERLPEAFRYPVWMGFARVDIALERYGDAIVTLKSVRELTLTPDQEPSAMLLAAEALAGADSLDGAIKTYEDITGRFSRGEYAAEAHYRLATIYEDMDSVETAKGHYEGVSRAYANSEHSREAVRRASNLSKLMRLSQAADDESPEALAMRQFSMAELQLLQFENTESALELYEEILAEYPDTEFAPRAAYAVGYIYGVVLGDSTRALESFRLLMTRYRDTQQAVYADQFITPLGLAVPDIPPPPVDTTAVIVPEETPPAIAVADTTTAVAIEDTTTAIAVEDTTTTVAPADTTTTAPADRSGSVEQSETAEEEGDE